MALIQRRGLLTGGAAFTVTTALGCSGTPGNYDLTAPIREALRPLGVVLPVINATLAVTNAIAQGIARRRNLKLQRGLYEVGQGTLVAEEMVATGSELPGRYTEAYQRITSRLAPDTGEPVRDREGFSTYLNPGAPILPVLGDPDQLAFFEGQFFEGDVYGRTMKLLFMKGHEAVNPTIRPVPEPFADVYLRRDKCLGHPMGDPEWGNCSCGAQQVRQRFMGHPKGVIYTYPLPGVTHKHDREGEPLKDCLIMTTEMSGPIGGVCDAA